MLPFLRFSADVCPLYRLPYKAVNSVTKLRAFIQFLRLIFPPKFYLLTLKTITSNHISNTKKSSSKPKKKQPQLKQQQKKLY